MKPRSELNPGVWQGSAWVTALRNSPQRFLYDLARRPAHLHVPNLLTSDHATVNSLPECLADEVPLDGAGFDQVEDRSQRASELVALCCLYVTSGQARACLRRGLAVPARLWFRTGKDML